MPITQPLFIGLAGPAGSGKDSVRDVLELQHEFGGFGFADPIRDMLRVLLVNNGCSPDYMERRDLKEVPVPGLGISYRYMAQTLGTELVRNNWGQDFWLKLAATNMASMREHGYRNFVISDVRFANEAEWVRNQGGEIWLLDRPGTAPVREHVSEAMPFTADRIIHNHGRLSDLQRTVFDALALARGAQAVAAMTTPTHAAQLGPGIGTDAMRGDLSQGITYLCGPCTGYPQHNHPAFHSMARALREHGVVVFNPAENGLPANAAWNTHMRVDIRMLMGCDRVATLPGIEASKGAQLELHIARELGMPVHQADKLLAWLQRNGGDSHQATTFHTTKP